MNLADGRMQTLPVYIYSQYAYKGIPPEAYVDRAWAAPHPHPHRHGLNLIARLVAKVFAPKTGR
jgi:phosphate transport system permease protein